MIAALQKLRNRIKSIPANTVTAVAETVANNTTFIENLNIEQLKTHGVTALSKPVEPPYLDITKQIKKVKGQPYNRVTLRDRGDFHKSFYVEVEGDGFRIDATDEKRDDLVDKYTVWIFGLSKDSRKQFLTMYRPEIVKNLRKLLWRQS
jgi:hypothetical protein